MRNKLSKAIKTCEKGISSSAVGYKTNMTS